MITVTKDGRTMTVTERSFERVWKQKGWRKKPERKTKPSYTEEAVGVQVDDETTPES